MLTPLDLRGETVNQVSARPVLSGVVMTTLASRTALAFVAVVSAGGCALPGVRAEGGCPIGEVCSDQTPDGLFFQGTAPGDGFAIGVTTTAKGGTQTIQVLLGNTEGSLPLDQAFDAATSNVTVASISSVEPPNVIVRGESAGTSSLRLLESGTNKLLDQLSIQVAEIDKVTLFPKESFLFSQDDGSPWALLSGAKVPLVVQLKAKNGDRLIDETLTLTPASGAVTPKSWDVFEITAPATGDASFSIQAGKSPFTVKAPVVAAIDDIILSRFQAEISEDNKLGVSTDHLVCFLGKSAGLTTLGATWTFTGTPTITFSEQDADTKLWPGNCTALKGTAVGPAKLTVTASGVSKSFDINFVKMMARKIQGAERDVATHQLSATSAAGERAGGN